MAQEPSKDVMEEPAVRPASQDTDDKYGVTWEQPIEGTGVKTPQPIETVRTGVGENENTGEVSSQMTAENKDNSTHVSDHHEVLETSVSDQTEVRLNPCFGVPCSARVNSLFSLGELR